MGVLTETKFRPQSQSEAPLPIGSYARKAENGMRPSAGPDYVGFNSETQASFIHHLIGSTGLPTDKVRRVSYTPNKRGQEQIMGSWERRLGIVRLYKSLENLPHTAQRRTVTHELGHAVSPGDPRNAKYYESEEARRVVVKFTEQVARQCEQTGIFLDGYHTHLYKLLQRGGIDINTFFEETWAILTELRYTNAARLKDVEQRQVRYKTKNRLSKDKPLLALTSKKSTKGESISHLDRALMQLTKSNNVTELEEQIEKSRLAARESKGGMSALWEKVTSRRLRPPFTPTFSLN